MVASVVETTPHTIFLSNKEYLNDYAEHFSCHTAYMPACGNDLHCDPGREAHEKILFIGFIPQNGTMCALDQYDVARKVFHTNRRPIIQRLRKSGHTLRVIHDEGTTADQKWLYANAKYSLSISPPVHGYSSNRLFNILSSGGFCLALYFPGIEDLFTNHRDLVWFKTLEEAVDMVQYYDAHEEQRAAVAATGLITYLKHHTAAHRVDAMHAELLRG